MSQFFYLCVCTRRAEEDIISPGARVGGDYKPYDMGARNGTQVL